MRNSETSFLIWLRKKLDRATPLTTQSLTFYRQSSNPTMVDPGSLVSEVTAVYSVKLKKRNVSLERKDRPCRPITCMESEIRQVVSNFFGTRWKRFKGKVAGSSCGSMREEFGGTRQEAS